ncbi:MAG: tRNA (N6-threonylcarbamoyladenosine(37)-N6)-methyltransferase TrmO [Desulfitobacteriaceae bacterium]|nr:tRNA (N6-threonylcarbamoyladenosine(37)-N6)-methyltransferase TrmO [Desulfitobacteriaceae bacterium]MDI6915381.1 tRNA (N6-threonylcarbamoyladenosine(37)-N6)-methyltransferase TrmO [Desulfitobacteriaceae bacterium]
MDITFQPIGTIHTPYFSLNAPHQPLADAPGEFWLSVAPEYQEALARLDSYKYIYVLYYLDKAESPALKITPSWAPEFEVGLFASRSENRPNPIGLSIVEVKEISGNEIVITGIDVFNGTPLLDIKPYVRVLDLKKDANDGWYDDLEDKDHLVAHMLGLIHEHAEDGEHSHSHHGHSHTHGSHGPSHSHSPMKIRLKRSPASHKD